tara:strand:+ start:198 stop:854 length:657 start_codon:yes stop_codon:yes gene_type:complete
MKNIQYINWDKTNWTRALNFLDENKTADFENKNVLELGGGEGSLSMWASHNGAKAICSDIIKPGSLVLNKLYKEKVRFEIIDAQDIPYENHFDFIIFKSLLGGIGRNNLFEKQIVVMEQIKKSLKKNGECLFMENMKGTILHQIYRNRYGTGKNDWNYPSFKEFYKMSNIFKDVKFNTYGFFGSTRKMKKDLRAKFDYNYDKYLPENWRYVYAGIYRK